MAIPPLTPAERAAALEKAAQARQTRADLKRRLKSGEIGLQDVIAVRDSDPAIGRLRVLALIESMPGIGPVKAEILMEEFGISMTRRVKGIGRHQLAALMARFPE